MEKKPFEIQKMSINELVKEINFLASEQKKRSLNELEATYQKQLRERYLTLYKQNFKQQLRGITIIDENGNDITSEKLKSLQENENQFPKK